MATADATEVLRVDPAVQSVLGEGRQLHLSVAARRGPHLTPQLYAMSGDRIVFFVARDTVKASVVSSRPEVCGLVRVRSRSVVVGGNVRLLDPARLHDLVRRPGELLEGVVGAAGFALRNAADLAGFGADLVAGRLGRGLPPRRLLALLEPARVAVVDGDQVVGRWGAWRSDGDGTGPGDGGDGGGPQPEPAPGPLVDAAVGWDTPDGPLTLPARWDAERLVAHVPGALLAMAGAPLAGPVAVSVDSYGGPGPAAKRGEMVRGRGEVRREGAVWSIVVEPERVTSWDGVRTDTRAPDGAG